MTRTIGFQRLVMVMIIALLALTTVGPVHPAMALSCAGVDRVEGSGPGLGQGTTFVGTYLGSGDHPTEMWHEVSYWVVERVYAGGPLPTVLSFSSPPCRNVTLEPGERYLFSTSEIGEPTYLDSVAWRFDEEGGVTFAPLWYLEPGHYGGASDPLVATNDFRVALGMVAPGATEGDPPSDADGVEPLSGRIRVTWPGQPVSKRRNHIVVTDGAQVESDDARLNGPAVVDSHWEKGRAYGEFTIRNDEGSWRASARSSMETDPRPDEGSPRPHLSTEYIVWGRGDGGNEGLLLFARLMPAPDLPGWSLEGWLVPEFAG